jgi:uncharacterized protein (DUF433 family)
LFARGGMGYPSSMAIHLEESPVCSTPDTLGGTLRFRGTRVPAQTLLDYLDDGYTIDEFIEFFDSVRKDDAIAFLKIARGDATAA